MNNRRTASALLAIMTSLIPLTQARAQSSSLYLQQQPAPQPMTTVNGQPDRLSPSIARSSYSAVRMPEPRRFAINDLISIIVRESSSNGSQSSLETTKETTLDGELSAFPRFDLTGFLNIAAGAHDFDGGTPKIALDMSKEFEGEGKAERRDDVSDRVTARVIDVKPNGNLVLEARKMVRADKEELQLVLSGTCRAADVTADNAVLSTQLFDLHLDKQHKGEVRNAAKKGLLTKLFEGLFAF